MNIKKRLEKLESEVKLKTGREPINYIILRGLEKGGSSSSSIGGGWRWCKESCQYVELSNEELKVIKENEEASK